MDIPDDLTLYSSAHGHGAHGMAFCRYADQDGFGVHLDARRESFGQPFVDSYWLDALPEQRFPTLLALQLAAEALTADQVATERAKYPQIRNSRPAGERRYQTKCHFCRRAEDRPGALIVHLAKNWNPVGDYYVELCEQHRGLAEQPPALAAALHAELAERKARMAARGLPW